MSQVCLRWHVLGAGSIGCLWGAHLAMSGCDVTLLLRNPATCKTLRDNGGIHLATGEEERLVPVAGEPVGVQGAACKHVLVATKAHQTLEALEGIAGRIVPGSCLVLLQNGMGIQELVAEKYPQVTLFVGTTTEGAWRRGRFTIVHAGHGTTWVGAGPCPIDAAERARVIGAMSGTRLQTVWEENLRPRLWRKLAVNCAINPTTALCACRNGELSRSPAARRLLRELCIEIERVLAAEGIALNRPVFELVVEVAEATAANRSSMLEDVRAGRRTEIDWINGFLLSRADVHGVATPLNATLVDLVRTMELARDNNGHSG